MSLPAPIKKLDETVVNRIAAGEVIQRPANAIKELLENSLDAKSTNINIILKNGGLKLLQIQDNGTGIRKEDLEIVCERFTTSKLREFEDLSSIATFGFRGEALSSISHVAHLTITTKMANQPCAYKACYMDGVLKEPPKAYAGNQGTIICVEDLFYNVATRRKAFKSPSEEHAKVSDVIAKYSIHNPSVGFSLKKHGENLSDIKTNPNSTHIDNIKLIYGNNIARELLEVEYTDTVFKFKMKACISNVNYSTKKQTFILFINNRLVDSQGLRKAIENVYSLYLPKGSYPFVYMSLELDPKNVDVNVHPTKHEVHFLHEDSVIENTRQAIEKKLIGANTSRTFYTQAKLPGVDVDIATAVLEKSVDKSYQKNMVRTDSTSQKLDKFLCVTNTNEEEKKPVITRKPSDIPNRREINLTSVLSLRKQVEVSCNIALRDIIANHTFVGCVSQTRTLIQHSTELYVCNTRTLLEEFFYQQMLYDFGNFGVIKFTAELPLGELVRLGIDDPLAGWTEQDGPKEQLAQKIINILMSKATMLQDYFSIEMDENIKLSTIPLILENYKPDMSRLPVYLLKLACDVDWSNETSCFKSICRETAIFYSYISPTELIDNQTWEWVTEHVIYPALKTSVLPPKKFAEDGTFLKLTSLPELYKVFERC